MNAKPTTQRKTVAPETRTRRDAAFLGVDSKGYCHILLRDRSVVVRLDTDGIERTINLGEATDVRYREWVAGEIGWATPGAILQPLLDADHDEGEVEYLELREALRRVDEGESYRSVAASLPISRQGLSGIHQDDHRRTWYLDAEADDDRVDAALESVRTPPPNDDPTAQAETRGK